jgi:hypothetical protein
MAHENRLRGFPERLRAGTQRGDSFYARVPGYYAAHDAREGADAAGAVMTLKEEGISVYRGEPGGGVGDATTVTPVYELQPSGPLAVPTGQIFLRFAEGVAADSQRREIESAGYRIVKTSQYTPHSAWLIEVNLGQHRAGAVEH